MKPIHTNDSFLCISRSSLYFYQEKYVIEQYRRPVVFEIKINLVKCKNSIYINV